jgi:hypothetical protein
MRKMREVKIGGGFHNALYKRFLVPSEAYAALKAGDKAHFWDLLTERQVNRLQKHLCGMKGCVCGGRGWEWM